MKELSDFDKEIIKRREYFIRELKEEKQNLLERIREINKSIADYRLWNRQIKGREEDE